MEHLVDSCTCPGKTCTKCKKLLCKGQYTKQKNGKEGLRSVCHSCSSQANALWRQENAEYNQARARAYHQMHKEERNQKYKEWRQRNIEHDKARHKAYRDNNAEKVKKSEKEYKHKNRATIRDHERIYWANHRAQRRAKNRRAYLRNSEQILQHNRLYRQRKSAKTEIYQVRLPFALPPIKAQQPEASRAKWKQYYRRNRAHLIQRSLAWIKNNPEKHAARQAMRKTLKTQAGGTYTVAEWKALCTQYNHTCLRCGCTDVKLTVDHVIPISRGGNSSITNIQPLCGPCNSSKGTNITDYRTQWTD